MSDQRVTPRWHVDDGLLRRYVDGSIDQVRTASVETHLLGCERCRSALMPLVDAGRLTATWDRVVAVVDRPRRSAVEALLARMGVSDATARLLVATPSLRLSWLSAVVLALVFAVVAAVRGHASVLPFLALAPLLPLAGVAVAFGPGVDPAYEVGLAAPLRSDRLLLLRAGAVLAVSTVLAAVAGVALPGALWLAAAWLLPSFGVTLGSLALATVARPAAATAVVAGVWLVGVAVAVEVSGDVLAPFRTAGQTIAGLVALAAVVVLARRHEFLDGGRIG